LQRWKSEKKASELVQIIYYRFKTRQTMNKSFSWRVFTSFGLFLSFFMLLVSGVILYIFPGRSPGVVWELGGLAKPAWQNQHIIFGFAFSLLSLGHLFLINWHAFFSYLKTKTTQGISRPAELVTIIILSLYVGFGTCFGIQPFSGILEFGKQISKSWESKEKQAPKPLVERLTLAELTRQPGYGENPEARNQNRNEEHYNTAGSSSSRELAFRDEEVESSPDTTTNNTFTENNSTQRSDVQAPDDELHRRTRKSCSSCH
jgi:Domain of unknown function (DUF4405)